MEWMTVDSRQSNGQTDMGAHMCAGCAAQCGGTQAELRGVKAAHFFRFPATIVMCTSTPLMLHFLHMSSGAGGGAGEHRLGYGPGQARAHGDAQGERQSLKVFTLSSFFVFVYTFPSTWGADVRQPNELWNL